MEQRSSSFSSTELRPGRVTEQLPGSSKQTTCDSRGSPSDNPNTPQSHTHLWPGVVCHSGFFHGAQAESSPLHTPVAWGVVKTMAGTGVWVRQKVSSEHGPGEAFCPGARHPHRSQLGSSCVFVHPLVLSRSFLEGGCKPTTQNRPTPVR